MHPTHAAFTLGLSLFLGLNCHVSATDRSELLPRLDAALALSASYLIDEQSDDGAWRSKTYSVFQDGTALTPVAATTLFYLWQRAPESFAAYERAAAFLVTKAEELAASTSPLPYPVYTAATAGFACILGNRSERHLQAQKTWLQHLTRRRFSPALGWIPDDPQFGGWGYTVRIPHKPADPHAAGLFSANISSTLFGIAALRAAGDSTSSPAFDEIRAFVERCQNSRDAEEPSDPALDDGGFFFDPADETGNKAGPAGTDSHGDARFRSYGSTTADGVRALIACGLPPTHPRVQAAKHWLLRNFDATRNPGHFAADREVLRNSYYYYYCWSVAHALHVLNVQEIDTPDGHTHWAIALAEELIAKQRTDGSWTNRYTDAKEDDPLVATPLAAAALAVCRKTLTVPATAPRPTGHAVIK